MNALNRTLSVIRLGRPVFLLGGFALYGLGTLAAVRRGATFDLQAFALGQLAISAIQLMTHYANDYYDYAADKANSTPTRWSGGSRVLVNDELPRIVALRAAVVVGLVAPLAAVTLMVYQPGRQLGAVTLLAIIQALAWSYAGPPLYLHTRGFGEPATALIVPLLTPLAGFVVQTGRLELFPMLLSAPLCLLQIVMLLSIEFADHAGDRKVGKLSWVVLLGPARAARLIQLLIVAAFCVTALGPRFEIPARVALAWLALGPLAVVQIFRLQRGDHLRPASWETLGFTAVALFFLAIVADLLALA